MRRRAAAMIALLAGCARPAGDDAPALAVVHPGAAELAPGGFAFLSGRAAPGTRLVVDGLPVPVHPGGGFTAFRRVPPAARPWYELVAVRGSDTVRMRHPVRLGGRPALLPADGPLRIDSASVQPRGVLSLRPDERVEVRARVPANADVWVRWPGGRRPLSPLSAPPSGPADPYLRAAEVPVRALAAGAELWAARGADTVRIPLARVTLAEADRWVELRAGPEGTVPAAASPRGGFEWFLLPGTRLRATGARDGHTRVRLDARREVWIRDGLVAPLAPGPEPARAVRAARVVPRTDRVDVQLAVDEPPPFRVEQGAREISLLLPGVRVPAVESAGADPLLRGIEVRAEDEGSRIVVRLSRAPFGYEAGWRDGRLVMSIRRPPAIDARRPLRGVVIAVDAGHPPGGAVGPTGLREAEATLAVARRLARRLEARGARVVMLRADDRPVALEARVAAARAANAHALVSLHADAVPPSVNPAEVAGTSTYFFHPHAEPLARRVQAAMVRRMGLRDLGFGPRSLVLVRPTWMPAVLAEGATLVVPAHEAALRTRRFQEAYARGVAEGVEAYFRTLGEG